MATIAILQIINKAAIIDVNLVKKVPIDLADVKFSCETPRPKAPPSDRCNKITMTNHPKYKDFKILSWKISTPTPR